MATYLPYILLSLLLLYSSAQANTSNTNNTPCNSEKANHLVRQAFDIAVQDDPNRQQGLLESALRHCATHPEALNNLGVLHERQGKFAQALQYYQQALRSKPSLAEAWLGIGDVYRQQGQLPRALEAYLNACQQDEDAKKHILALLKDERYRAVEDGQILDKDSLLALYDPARHQAILANIKRCGLKARLAVKQTAVFRNFQFATGKATLADSAVKQLTEIAAALQSLPNTIAINGHTDRQLFKGRSQTDSDRLNRQLSQQRAETIKQALIRQGISASRITSAGFGADQPLVKRDSQAAYAQNRRVEIELR